MSLFTNLSAAAAKAAAIWNTVSAVWPAAQTFVQQVEGAFPAGTAGATKLAQVGAFLESAWSTISGIEVAFGEAWPTLQALIGTLVSLYNAVGLFKHGTPPATATASASVAAA